jgi:type II secretion system protein H
MFAIESAGGDRTRRGFTLTELLIVIALIGLLFGLVFMKLDNLVPGQRLKADARELASHLDQARNYAIVSGKQVKFAYDIDNRAYRYYVPFELSDDGTQIVGPGEFELHDWIFLRDNVEFKDIFLCRDIVKNGVVTVTFEPRGIATDHLVHLGYVDVDPRDACSSLMISPLLGYIDLFDIYKEPEMLDKSAF